MRLITQQQNIAETIPLFVEFRSSAMTEETICFGGKTWREQRAAVEALDPATCTCADVEAIVGPTGIMAFVLDCDECDKQVDRLVRFGENPGYDVRWWDVCLGCLQNAALLLPPAELQR